MNKKVLHSVIDQMTAERGIHLAVDDGKSQISYLELRSRSNSIARRLVSSGLKHGDVVGVYMESSTDYVCSILAANKAGGIFMPLELAYPVKRTEFLLQKVRPGIIITCEAHLENLLNIYRNSEVELKTPTVLLLSDEGIRCVSLRSQEVDSISSPTWNDAEFDLEVHPDDSNYILYTSGSTGLPKIIEGCHKSLSHFIHWEKGEFQLDASVRVSQLAPVSFDVSLRDIFVPLLSGGTLYIPERDVKRDPVQLLKWIGEKRITLIHTVPSMFRLLTNAIAENSSLLPLIESVSYILLAGEALFGRDVVAWRTVAGKKAQLVNLYGPTETTLAKIFNRVEEDVIDPSAIIPLGKPISNTAVLIISDDELCNTGIIGEIHIKTPFRSKGYYKDDELTKERFIQNPLHNDYEDIVYKTGDLGRYLTDKRIEFIGREDGQIKIRGNRVEILEIEKVLMSYAGVRQVVVLPVKKHDGEDTLCCYYTEDESVQESLLRAHVGDYLPDYMHPSYYVRLEEFPLNLNGKVDKRSLPRPEELLYEKLSYEAPATELELKIASIWSDVLSLKKVGVLNSFFELGGHSLTATRVVSRIYQELEKEISLKDFFDYPTVRSLCAFLDSKSATGYQVIERLSEQDHYEVSHAQKRLWITDQLHGSVAYHMLGGCYINKNLDVIVFDRVLQTIVARHESLRTTFIEVDGVPRQRIHVESSFRLQHIDLVLDPLKNEKTAELIRSEQTSPFDLEHGPLLRSKLIQLESEKYLFLLNIHHIVSDGWSTAVLIKEILALYEAYQQGNENPLVPLRIHYRDYAAWQNRLIEDTTKNYRPYWHKKLGGDIPVLNLPTDCKRPEDRSYEGSRYSFTITQELSDSIRSLCRKHEASLFMFFLAVIDIELSHLSGQKDILTGSAVAGRNHPELENQIGFYLNNLVLRNEVDVTITFQEFFSRVKTSTLDAYEYQEYPYDKLVEELKPSTPEGRNSFYDVLLVMNNEGLNGDQNEMRQLERILGVEQLAIEENTSKLDLSFFIDDSPKISMTVEYSTVLFKESTIAQLTEDIARIIDMCVTNETINIGDMIWTLTGVEKEELLGSMNEISDNF